MAQAGLLVVISAPSGGGKTTILRKVLELGRGEFRYSVSATTRPRRHNEIDGHDYYFISLDEFHRKRVDGEFVEWAEVHGNYYATPKQHISEWLADGRLVLSDLDVKGGLAVKQHFGDSALLIFVKPPSLESLVERLRNRDTESQSEIDKRLQRFPAELEMADLYDHQCVNDDLDETTKHVLDIINGHYCLS